MSRIEKKISNFLVFLWVSIYFFDAPIQYILYRINAQSILVILKAVLPISVLIIGTRTMIKKKFVSKKLVYIMCLVIYATFIAILNELPFTQIAYGLKTVIPFFAIYIYIRYSEADVRYFKKLFRILLPIVVLGVLADKFFTFPWEGLSYQVGEIEYQISREWETFGVVRLSGLQRASYDCAIMISLLLVLDCIYRSIYENEKSSIIYRCYDGVLWLAAAYGIYLTTFKSAYIFIVALVLYRLLIKLYKKMIRKYKFIIELILKFFLLCILLYALLPPILSIMGRELFDTSDASFLYQFLFASYSVRMSVTWPKAVGLLDLAKFNGFLGRGIGGIGTAQQHGERALYCAGDNVFIILYVILGVVSVIFILGIIITILKTKFIDKQGYIIYYLLIMFLCFGATVSVLDSPMLMSGLGLLLACYTEVGIDVNGYENHIKKSQKRSKVLR